MTGQRPDEAQDPYALWDGAYVLGALPPAERREFEDHLAGCASCRARVAAVSGLPGLLSAAGAEAFAPAAESAPPAPYALYAEKVRRRRARRVGLAAAAVLVVGLGMGAAGLGLGRQSAPPQASVAAGAALHFADAGTSSPLQATGTLTAEPWGSRLSWSCSYAAAGTPGYTAPSAYELVVVTRAGASTVVGSWSAGPGETVNPVASTSVPKQDIASVIIRRTGSGVALLAATP
ncbi:hypothetical protein AL755_11685 [Arthrobacter sp. ERGS1:01]|uniref:zf-HC2 domain-containing protein n=1 Tax=Arthrobacter sp. ERGS1:01 TaxID=1704044 RepID=UPI0006B57302|nr:zf-HC2 domain-containing protein [Arthrobacter sp. ERGS1:01]ALE05977.1 hypothetical protein AL755_11685 [Arthrobacter sp. ERGS1:01]